MLRWQELRLGSESINTSHHLLAQWGVQDARHMRQVHHCTPYHTTSLRDLTRSISLTSVTSVIPSKSPTCIFLSPFILFHQVPFLSMSTFSFVSLYFSSTISIHISKIAFPGAPPPPRHKTFQTHQRFSYQSHHHLIRQSSPAVQNKG